MSKELDYRVKTDHDLLVALVPDIDQRLETARGEDRELFKEIHRRAVETRDGWRPLHDWRGYL